MSVEQKRRANEKKFGRWEEQPRGGRRNFLEIPGVHGWMARYVKEVDPAEQTVRFYQEIFNEERRLVEVHEKYPVDKGHVAIKGE